jgi:hypothetical protein
LTINRGDAPDEFDRFVLAIETGYVLCKIGDLIFKYNSPELQT